MTRQFQPVALRRFLRADDRRLNPFFVGRNRIIDDIMCIAQDVAAHDPQRDPAAPGEGRTQLIQGPPGIGKTSLLRTIQERCIQELKESTDRRHRVIPVLITDPKELSREHVGRHITQTIEEIHDRLGNREARAFVRNVLGAVQSVTVLGVGFQRAPKNDGGTDIPVIPTGCSILLMIDEIQTIDPTPNGPAARILQFLEGGSKGQPILPILAGLSNSRDILDSIGLSRTASQSVHSISSLSKAEVAKAVQLYIKHFGITATHTTCERWVRTLGRWSKGWPKHLQNGLAVLGENLLTENGELDRVDMMITQMQAVERRIDYYWTRFGTFRRRPALIGQIMAHLGTEAVSQDAIEMAIRSVMQMEAWRGVAAPKFDDMLRRGLIDEIMDEDVLYACPVPSLRSFAVAHTGTPLHLAALRGRVDRVSDRLAEGIEGNVRDSWGRTPLHLAAQENWPDIITVLLANGTERDAVDQWGRTPLHLAAKEDAEDSIRALLAAHAPTHRIDVHGETPLHYAARADCDRAVAILLATGAKFNACNQTGQTPADLAPLNSISRRLLEKAVTDANPKVPRA